MTTIIANGQACFADNLWLFAWHIDVHGRVLVTTTTVSQSLPVSLWGFQQRLQSNAWTSHTNWHSKPSRIDCPCQFAVEGLHVTHIKKPFPKLCRRRTRRQWGVSSVPFPFWFPFHLHFNLVSSTTALAPNAVELEWQLKWIISVVISLLQKR